MTVFQTAAQMTGRPYNNRVITIGDSRTFSNTSPLETNRKGLKQNGPVAWARMLGGQRFVYEPSDNYGVGGDTTAMMLARVPAMLAANDAAFVIYLGGTNDWAAGMNASQTIANIAAARDLCIAAGRVFLIIAEAPRGDAANPEKRLSAANLRYHMAVRQWVLGQSQVPGCYPVDVYPALAEPASTTGDAKAAVMRDGLHWSPFGAMLVGIEINKVINTLLPSLNICPANNSDVFSVENPYGVKNTNPMVDGTGGTLNSATGQIATGWTATGTDVGGTTRAMAKVTDASNAVWQQLTISGTPTGAAPVANMMRQNIGSGWTSGMVVRGVGRVEADAGMSGIQSVELFIDVLSAGVVVASTADMRLYTGDQGTIYAPNVAWSGVMKTPELTLPATFDDIQFGVRLYGTQNIAMAGVVRARALAAQQVMPAATVPAL